VSAATSREAAQSGAGLGTTQHARDTDQLSVFARIANATAHAAGKPLTFGFCFLIVIVWAVSGPIFHYSDTWQLVINTGTTIITFLMVFLIQNTQNRDTVALQVKLDELILALDKARNELVGIEEEPEEILEHVKEQEHRKARGTSEMNGAKA
jgi:low affinity Fe/Cu permease